MARADAGEGGMAASAPALLAPVRVPFAGGEGTRRPTRVCLSGKTHPLRAARAAARESPDYPRMDSPVRGWKATQCGQSSGWATRPLRTGFARM